MLGQGRSTAYDATADRWETLYGGPASDDLGTCASRPECRRMDQMVYDPVNERLVVYGGTEYCRSTGVMDPDDVLAFDTRTREWTVLLEASEGGGARGRSGQRVKHPREKGDGRHRRRRRSARAEPAPTTE